MHRTGMSMDGCAYANLRLPLISGLFHIKRPFNVSTGIFHHAVSFQRHLHSHDMCIHAAILDLAIGSATYGTQFILPVTSRNDSTHTVLRKQENCIRLKSCRTDISLDLESQILEFMEHSERPDLFPSRSELLKAGRSDLVEAILAKGGWMVAGWDMEPGVHDEAQSCDVLVMNGIAQERTGNESFGEFQESHPANFGDGLGLADKTEGTWSSQTLSPLERQRAWEKVANLFGLSNSTQPEHDTKSVTVANQEIPKPLPDVINGMSALAQQDGVQDHDRIDLTNSSLAGGNKKGSGLPSKAIKRKKKQRQKPSKFLNRGSSVQKGCVTQTKHNDEITDDNKQNKEIEKSISLRIQGLESELVSFLDIMKSGRSVLNDGIRLKQADSLLKAELEEVSDALEFCETQIMNKKRELRTAHAQRTAIEGKLALELMEIKRSMEEKDKQFEQTTGALKKLCTARIVWPNAGREVLLAGSYDGWASWKKMEKSSAGVFVTTLLLYPGQYEIKFIVDGVWIADPNRPRTWENGYENNVLMLV